MPVLIVQAEDKVFSQKQQQEYKVAEENMIKAAILGPNDIPLLDQGILHLPENYVFIPKAEAVAWLKSWGNSGSSGIIGIIMPIVDNQNWFIEVNYEKSGYIKDDDAKNWNADKLLQNLKEGTKEQNKYRKAKGFEEFEVVKWIEVPTYNALSHKLIWSIVGRTPGDLDEKNYSINYNTYALGREGYFIINLITSYDFIEQDKLHVKTILAAVDYNNGKRYEDFLESTDKVATYGLAALIGGAVAKKVGLLTVIGVFLLKIWKIIAIAVAVFFGKIMNFFKRDKDL
ncbi:MULTISPECIES: DUF2167 domain-containing protein [unclassified Rickettsia]